MNKIFRISLVLTAVVLCFYGTSVFGQVGGVTVQTNSATNIYNNQATLNGYLSVPYISGSTYVYFQWGDTINYNNQSAQQYLNNSGSFSQNISGLNSYTTYHFRAVAQGSFGTVYGPNMTFVSNQSNNNYYGTGNFSVSKKVINLTSGNLNWSSSVNANPSDILSFAITLQANGQDIHNVVVRDILPANLIYRGNLTVNTNSNYVGNIISGVNINTVYANQPVVVSYQAQVAPTQNFAYGTTVLNNSATITSTEVSSQFTNASVVVNKSTVYGASTVATGSTNNFLTDSFLLPLMVIITGLWLYLSGQIYVFADKLKLKLKK